MTLERVLRDCLEAIDAEGMHPNFDEWRDDEVDSLLGEFMHRCPSEGIAHELFMVSFMEQVEVWTINDLHAQSLENAMRAALTQNERVCQIVADWLAEYNIKRIA